MLLPDSFKDFLERNSIPLALYERKKDKRYFIDLSDASLQAENDDSIIKESGICGSDKLCWYSLPSSANIARMKGFQSGDVLSIDPSSSLAVLNLLHPLLSRTKSHSKENEGMAEEEGRRRKITQYLDLCCAPGPKIVLASALLRKFSEENNNKSNNNNNDYYLTGVDLSKRRLESCRAFVKKYSIDRLRLFLSDSSEWMSDPVVFGAFDSGKQTKNARTMRGKQPFYSSSSLRKRPTMVVESGTYDYILVDAPCTHDGSVKHFIKHQMTDWKEYKDEHYTTEYCIELRKTQLAILKNGFELLTVGGHILYSTCSLSKDQNEGVIDDFFETFRSRAICVKPVYGPMECLVYWGGVSGADNDRNSGSTSENLTPTTPTMQKVAMRLWPDSKYYDGFFLCLIKKVY